MSGLALALLKRGFTVSGSDSRAGARTHELIDAGVDVHIGHSAANIAGAEVVVYTTAIRDTNPELSAARAAGLQIVHRAEVLAYMTAGKHGIAVTGTHGKSTTTAMLATILTGLGLDPTVFVGADAPNIGANGHSTNFRLGDGGAVIFEACESDGSFLQYEGCSQILLNLEAEHLDQHHDLEASARLSAGSWQSLIRRASSSGAAIVRSCRAWSARPLAGRSATDWLARSM